MPAKISSVCTRVQEKESPLVTDRAPGDSGSSGLSGFSGVSGVSEVSTISELSEVSGLPGFSQVLRWFENYK
jgi:hypothetical protein